MRCWLAVRVTMRAMACLLDVAGARRSPTSTSRPARVTVQVACQNRGSGTDADKTARGQHPAGWRAPRGICLCGVLYHNIRGRCTGSTRWALTIAVIGPAIGSQAGQPAAAIAAGLDPARGLALFQDVRSWFEAGEAPPVGPRVAGAMVWARSGDLVLARVSAVTTDPTGLDLAGLVRSPILHATSRVLPGGVRDATWRQPWSEAVSQMRLSVEVSGVLVPYRPRTFRQVDLEVAPGLEGVAVRSGDSIAAVFPSAQQAARMTPSAALSAAIAQVTETPGLAIPGDPEGEPGVLADRLGLTYYRFRTVHVAQTRPGEPGAFLYRGSELIAESSVNERTLRDSFEATLGHLCWRAEIPSGPPAAYDPVSNRLLGTCDERQRALAAYALARGSHSAPGEGLRRRAGHAARILLDAPEEPRDATARALTLLGLDALEQDPGRVHALAQTLERESVEGVGVSILAHALAKARRADVARALLDGIYRDTPPGELAAHLPWIVWAEQTLAGEGGAIAASAALRQVREAVQASVLTHADAGEDGLDMVGGVVFSAGGAPLPSWHTSRAVAGLAAMLNSTALTDANDRLAQVARLAPMLRFLRQLEAEGGARWLYADPDLARGGVRPAVWDQRQPIEACAMQTLALAQTLEALEQLASERASGR